MKQEILDLALELAVAAKEEKYPYEWRAVGIQRDIDNSNNTWVRWSSIAGWPLDLANKIDRFILEQRKQK